MSKENGKEKMTFEQAAEQLEAVLQKLERNDCPLDEAMSLFQEGMKLVQFGRRKLQDVEKKVSLLLKEAGEFVPFNGEEDQA